MKITILRDCRMRAGKKIAETSDYMGISDKTLHKWEHGGLPRYRGQLNTLLDYYMVDPAEQKEILYYLYSGKDDDKNTTGYSISKIIALEKSIDEINRTVEEMRKIIASGKNAEQEEK